MSQPIDFPTRNNGHLLIIVANSPPIPQVDFKVFPDYDGSRKTPYKHC